MNRVSNLLVLLSSAWILLAAESGSLYRQDFEKAELNTIPEDFLVLDGAFAVKEEAGNKFVELPGAPLESFGFLFGPVRNENLAVSARIVGTSQGRRSPTFGVGSNGVGGYKLRVAPAKRAVELLRGDEMKNSVPFKWESGNWMRLKLQVRKAGDKEWRVEGKVWPDGRPEPDMPTIVWMETGSLPNGRAMVLASPYSGTPIRFDDLSVAAAE